MKPPLFALLLIGPSLVWAALLRSQPPEQGPLPRHLKTGYYPAPHFRLQGVNSCAAMACHNSGAANGATGNEYGVWIDKDRHARAYEVLLTARSRYIEKNLRGLHSIAQAHPEKNSYCLKCHVHPHADEPSVLDLATISRDGVSCEACHGPAEKWLAVHFQDSWKQKTSADKKAWGMYDTKTIEGRARLCIDCHVGSAGNDAGHDLLAAGHPRLNFEFAAYHALMPRHWNDAKDKDPAVDARGTPDFEARAWVIGQNLTAQAALEVLAARAENNQLPWPEFAEYDCYACHHGLGGERGTRKALGPRRAGAAPGTLEWQSWYTFMALPTRSIARGHADPRLADVLQEIRTEMGKPRPDRQKVAKNATFAAAQFRPENPAFATRETVEQAFRRIVRDDKLRDGATQNWDRASQFFNGLAALHNAWADMTPELTPRRAAIRHQLVVFGAMLPVPGDYESPKAFDPDSIKGALEELRKASP